MYDNESGGPERDDVREVGDEQREVLPGAILVYEGRVSLKEEIDRAWLRNMKHVGTVETLTGEVMFE